MVDGKCVTAKCSEGKVAEWVPLNYKNFTRDRMALHCINSQPIRVEGKLAWLMKNYEKSYETFENYYENF
jgi:hypothetical protein